jgi:hypothetical protein
MAKKSLLADQSLIFIEGLTRSGVKPDLINAGLRPRLEKLSAALERVHAELERAQSSGAFTPRGIGEQVARAATAAWKEIELVKADSTRYRQRVKEVEAQARASRVRETKADDVTRSLRGWELRSLLRGKSDVEAELAYREAVVSGDHELIEAVESSPRAFPVVKPQVVQELAGARLKMEAPTAWKESEDLSAIADAIDSGCQLAVRELSEVAAGSWQPPGGMRIDGVPVAEVEQGH